MTRFAMTDDEILSNWRQSNRSGAQVKRLAQLNGVTVSCMQEKLTQLGANVPETTDLIAGLPDEVYQAEYNAGKNDQQMAEALNVSYTSARKWRTSKGLPPNGVSGKPTVGFPPMTCTAMVEILSKIMKNSPDAVVTFGSNRPVSSVEVLTRYTVGSAPEVDVRLA